MAFNKKQKIVTTALTAAMVASAVAPAAAATKKLTPAQDAAKKAVDAYYKLSVKTSADVSNSAKMRKDALAKIAKLGKKDANFKAALTAKVTKKGTAIYKYYKTVIVPAEAEAKNVAAAKAALEAAKAFVPTADTKVEDVEKMFVDGMALINKIKDAKTKEDFTKQATELKAAVLAKIEELSVAKVASVTADNLKNIVVKFNKEVEAKTVTASNVKLYDGSSLVSGVTLNVSDDAKSLYITSDSSFTQLKEYKVVVENVEQKGDATKKIAKTEKTVSVVDTTLPTVNEAKVLSPKTVEVTFSEPIKNFPTGSTVLTDIVQIDGINAYATVDQAKMVTANKVVLTLNTALSVGDHKVKVAGLTDYANLPIAAKEFTVNVAADTVAPEVTSIEAINKGKVKVTFSEVLDDTTVLVGNIKVNGTAVVAKAAKEGGKVYEFTLDAAAQLNLGATVESSFEYKGIKDNYGNEVKDAKVIKFTAKDDTTAPTVAGVKVNADNTMEVTLSEDVTGFTGTGKVELYDKDNKKLANVVTVAQKVTDGVASNKVYVLTITGGSSLSGAHSIKILKGNVKDLGVRTLELAETTQAVSLNDNVAPTVLSAVYVDETTGTDFNTDADVKDSKLTINFSEAMDNATILNKSNYIVNGSSLSEVSSATITAGADNKSVTITYNIASTGTQVPFSAADVRVLGVKDAVGNSIASAQFNTSLATNLGSAYAPFAPAVTFASIVDTTKVELVAKNQVKIYAAAGQTLRTIDPNKLSVKQAANLTAQVTGITVATDGKSAVLTLSSNLNANATTGANLAVTFNAEADAITNGAGSKSQAATGLVIVDKVTPLASTVTVADGNNTGNIASALDAGDKITIKFSENVDPSKVTIANIGVNKGHILGNASIAQGANASEFVITLGSTSTVELTDVFTIFNVNVVDAAGNTATDTVTFTVPTSY